MNLQPMRVTGSLRLWPSYVSARPEDQPFNNSKKEYMI